MAALNKPIVVILDDEAEAFFENLNEKTRNKFYVLFDKTESGLSLIHIS